MMTTRTLHTQAGPRVSALLLLAGGACQLAASPKWLLPILVWIGPACLLYYSLYGSLRGKWWWLALVYGLAQAMAQIDVMPYPWFVLVMLVSVDTLKTVALYALHRPLAGAYDSFGNTLLFPALWTVREYLETQGGAGAFASIANTQYPFPWLIQLVSVTGIWGITFLIYWFGAVAVWLLGSPVSSARVRMGLGIYGGVLSAVLIYGAIRYEWTPVAAARQVRLGAISVPNTALLEALYVDYSGQVLRLSPTDSPASAPMQRVNTALSAFIEHPDPRHFRRSKAAMRQQQDDLFRLSTQAAQQGAQVVVWSEANALLLKPDEPALIRRGQQLATDQGIWLFMPMGVILPGKLTANRFFLENKLVIIRPDGSVSMTFHKNHPVPMAESSRPGDGIVPVLETPFGRLAASICYDADHISTMRQLGQQQAGLLVLPSGDWHSISPYHSYMAMFRAIENGCSLARPVSGGLSIFTDSRGRLLASRDAFAPGPNLTVTDLPVSPEKTLYTKLGDWLVYVSLAILLLSGLRILRGRFLRSRIV